MRATISQMVLEELNSWLKEELHRNDIKITSGRPGIDEWKVSEAIHGLIVQNSKLKKDMNKLSLDFTEVIAEYKEELEEILKQYDDAKASYNDLLSSRSEEA